MGKFSLIGRFVQFRKEIGVLWRAFFDASTPLYLKAATLGVVAYLISPIDLVPDFLPFLGIVDDIVLVPLMVSWIVSRLPQPVRATSRARSSGSASNGTIDGTYRRR